MNKYLTYIIGISCIVITGAVAYYFFSYLPSKNALLGQKECRNMALNKFEKDQSGTSEPEFVFDEKGRCLYKLVEVHSSEGISVIMFYIIDLYTNQQVAGYTETYKDGNKTTLGNQSIFDSIDKKYFKEQ